MIGWEDIYKIVEAMLPLYVALALGYSSVKWLEMFKSNECDAINRFNCYFIIPFFTFQFTSGVDPYHMNFRFLGADVIAKAIAGVGLALWIRFSKKDFSWLITSFSLSSFNNTLVVGVPLLKAMYGGLGEDLVVQSSVIQSLVWLPILLFMLEFRRACDSNNGSCINNENGQEKQLQAMSSSTQTPQSSSTVAIEIFDAADDTVKSAGMNITLAPSSSQFLPFMKKVWIRLSKNPNNYACVLGLIWALLANRWNLKMPRIVEGSILIMSKAGSGVAMFNMGLFMALQESVLGCGVGLCMYGMVLRFVGGPMSTAVGSLALGLHSNVLRIAIIQAALPQAIVSFVFAQEYGLHANLLSTAVIFGTIISLPLLIVYYLILNLVH
ncbi:auxin efflux carrier component 5 isoform X1 [Primulina eburnea]|uniref:auxin efflux carrier component 5 isoform X1 n=1 Tax=Primulina eburnea TaxID=1245227 RepID=UPI003C6BE19A